MAAIKALKNKTFLELESIGEIMKDVKVPISRSYQEYLISSLKDPQEAAAYIETFLESEEDGSEPELLKAALKDVIDARIQSSNLLEKTKQHYEKLDRLLSETGGAEIYGLIELLHALGFRIEIAPQ